MERGVIITLDNGTLGMSQPTEDGIFGMILFGNLPPQTESSPTYPTAIYSTKDAEDLGITEANDSLSSVDTHFQIKSFYSFAENTGRKLWISVIENPTTLAAVFGDNNSPATKIIEAAQGEISMLFVGGFRGAEYEQAMTYSGGIDSQTMPAVIAAHNLANSYALKIKPFRVIIDGYALNNANLLINLNTMTYNRVGIYIGTNSSNAKNSQVGLLAGRLAYTPVNESAGWVAKGNVPITEAYLTNKVAIEKAPYINDIIDKGYITFQKYPTKYGYFFSNPTMATGFVDDYRTLTNARAIDKAFKLAYNTFVNYVNGKLYVTAKGTINIMQIKAMEADIENVINLQMIAKGECSFVKCIIDPTQKVLSTNQLNIGLKIIPTATLELLKVKLGFAQSI